MTRKELEIKAKEFDSKLKRHPMSSEELQKVLCDFVEALRQPPVSRLLLLFDQMMKEENEALGKAGFYNQYGRETHANNKYCLAIVKSLIERRFGNSG